MGRVLCAGGWIGVTLTIVAGCAKPAAPAKPAAAAKPAAQAPAIPEQPAPSSVAAEPGVKEVAGGDVNALQGLRDELAKAPTSYLRVVAIDAIAELGPGGRAAIPELVAALGDADPRPRWHAARALGLIGEESISTVPALVKLLGDADPIVVTQAAAAIGMVKADDGRTTTPPQDQAIYDSAIEPLMKTCVHSDPRARRAAMRALERLVPDDTTLAPLFCKQLADTDPSAVLPALHTLADLDEKAVPFLLEALKEPKSRYWATVAIAEIGPEAAAAVEPLSSLVAEGELDERMQAALALAAIGEPAASAAPMLVQALESNEDLLRFAAAFALGKIKAESADKALEQAALDPDEFLAAIAAWARAQIHPQDAALVNDAVQKARKGLDSDRPNVRKASVSALSDLAEFTDEQARKRLAEEFVSLLNDADPAVGMSAGAALVRLEEVAVGEIKEALANPATRLKALEVAAALGAAGKAAEAEIEALLTSDDPLVQGEAAVALASMGPDAAAAVPALQKLLGDDRPANLRYAVTYALGRIGGAAKAAVPRLIELSKSDDELMATVATWAALKIEPQDAALLESAIPLLRKALRGGQELARLEAAVSLGDIGGQARSAIPILELVAEDDASRAVRAAAAEALAKIRGTN
jgi:HEAT repeat protein